MIETLIVVAITQAIEPPPSLSGLQFKGSFTHPNVTEVTGMTSPHSYTTSRQVKLFFELNTVAPQADPKALHHSVWGQAKGGKGLSAHIDL